MAKASYRERSLKTSHRTPYEQLGRPVPGLNHGVIMCIDVLYDTGRDSHIPVAIVFASLLSPLVTNGYESEWVPEPMWRRIFNLKLTLLLKKEEK
jgi:hypothetical protein